MNHRRCDWERRSVVKGAGCGCVLLALLAFAAANRFRYTPARDCGREAEGLAL